jgi:hypothetical protein
VESPVKTRKGTVKEIEKEEEAAAAVAGEEDSVWSPHSATTTMRMEGADSDHSGMQNGDGDEGDDEEGEGSLEDAIASLSSKVERVVSSTGTPGPVPVSPSIAHGEESLEEGRDSEAAPKVKVETVSGLLNIDSLGAGLPINVREALRYRIRKKM